MKFEDIFRLYITSGKALQLQIVTRAKRRVEKKLSEKGRRMFHEKLEPSKEYQIGFFLTFPFGL